MRASALWRPNSFGGEGEIARGPGRPLVPRAYATPLIDPVIDGRYRRLSENSTNHPAIAIDATCDRRIVSLLKISTFEVGNGNRQFQRTG